MNDKYDRLEKTNIKNRIVECACIVILILIGINRPIFMYLALGVASFVILKDPFADCIGILLFLLPYSQVFVKETVNGFQFYFVILFLFILRGVANNRFVPKGLLVLTALMVLDILCRTNAGGQMPMRALYAVFGCIFISVLVVNQSECDIDYLLTFYTLGILSSVCIAQMASSIPALNNYLALDFVTWGDTKRFCGLYGNPNYYTFDISISVPLLLYGCTKGKKNFKYIVFIVLLLLVGMFSVSLSFILSIIVAFVCYLLLANNKKNFKMKVIVIIVATIGINLAMKNEVLYAGFQRLMALDLSTSGFNLSTTNRYDIWMKFLGQIVSDAKVLLFGAGLYSTTESAHSFYIEYLYYFGIVGMIVFIAWIVSAVKGAINKENHFAERRHYLIFIMPLIFRAFGISLVAHINFWITLGLILIVVRENERKSYI